MDLGTAQQIAQLQAQIQQMASSLNALVVPPSTQAASGLASSQSIIANSQVEGVWLSFISFHI